ncbi:hypothetical protein CEUSTIGMA_g8257.t1 [Chlamydomonas eustigma]|uniref:S-acyltransferase n=1 Tax=Chlamydomonas eustigma TaxID=1157962 RepID=A0A250XD63_9CHLO|nr:hypothetical protein CEUSTIGMA_g8257.t1 [Chlamydomonas eustigma]|eukprot:GAX80822.1 hypothetical protein CEUSTIGMA_g8257.t1 [Chlamydomonas eustigma]
MVLIVVGIVGFTYYAVVPATYGPMLRSGNLLKIFGSLLVVVWFTILVIMIVWSYLITVSTDPGGVPPGWHPFSDDQQARIELERLSYSNYYFDRRDPRRPRFCKRCQAWKPERAHHCSVSGRCILKMDHYCIWVINCVGLLNYKFFLLFLFYAFLGSTSCFFLLLSSMIQFLQGKLFGPSSPFIFISVILNFAFMLALAGFMIMHFQMMSANCTTIEMYEKDRIHPWPYNRGLKRNFEDVFGRSKVRWFLPFYTKEEKRLLLDSCLHQGGSSSSTKVSATSPLIHSSLNQV